MVPTSPVWEMEFSHRIFWWLSPGSLKAWFSVQVSTGRYPPTPSDTCVLTVASIFCVKYVGEYWLWHEVVESHCWSHGTSGQLPVLLCTHVEPWVTQRSCRPNSTRCGGFAVNSESTPASCRVP